MKFEWDVNKNNLNIKRHFIDFNDAYLIFQQPMVVRVDTRKDYGEIRMVGLGALYGAVVVIVFTKRRDTIRVISMRRANKNEREIYKEKIQQNEY